MGHATKFFWDLPVFLVCFLAIFDNGVEATHRIYLHLQNVPASNVEQTQRTGYHFQPKKHWINDPNGPMYYNGVYHLFYQYNPKGAVWGNIVWAHSVSKDLINWKKLEHAIFPSKPFDKFGTWSGSATILPGNKPVILYTGIVDENKTQVQNYAVPEDINDPYLQKWIKPNDNPILKAAKSINESAWRDPTTAWLGHDGRWRILVGSRRKNRGMAYMYTSLDFKRWVQTKNPLHSVAGTGNWECPDFFPVSASKGLDTSVVGLDVKHVLKISLDVTRYDYYTIGKYDTQEDMYIPDDGMVDGWNGLRMDYGNYYASKSFFDPSKNRRVLWGWANESDAVQDDVKKGWAGVQLIPRTVLLDPEGKQLLLWPIEEVEKLRGQKVSLNNKKLVKGQLDEIKGITAPQADVEVIFSFDSLDKAEPFDPSWDKYDAQKLCSQKGSTIPGGVGPFGLVTLASQKLEEFTPVFFRVFKSQDNKQAKFPVLMCSDATRSSLKDTNGTYRPSFAGFLDVPNLGQAGNKISLRSLIDHSVVESFGEKGKTCITSRVYPTLAVGENAHLYVFNNGTEPVMIQSLNAWSMNNPEQMNH